MADDQGRVTTYCIYDAPSEERVREHAGTLGQHLVRDIHEVIGDIEPSTLRA